MALITAIVLTACGNEPDVKTYPPGKDIRGFTAPSYDCATHKGAPVHVPRVDVTRLLLCPVWPNDSKPVAVSPTSRLFAPILTALATPGARYRSGMPCAAYADVDQTVLARTSRVQVVVDIPRDSCGHYDRKLVGLLSEARSANGR